jgi:hypothetical protein
MEDVFLPREGPCGLSPLFTGDCQSPTLPRAKIAGTNKKKERKKKNTSAAEGGVNRFASRPSPWLEDALSPVASFFFFRLWALLVVPSRFHEVRQQRSTKAGNAKLLSADAHTAVSAMVTQELLIRFFFRNAKRKKEHRVGLHYVMLRSPCSRAHGVFSMACNNGDKRFLSRMHIPPSTFCFQGLLTASVFCTSLFLSLLYFFLYCVGLF